MDFSTLIYLYSMMIKKQTLLFIICLICESCFGHFFLSDCKYPNVYLADNPTLLLAQMVGTEQDYSHHVNGFRKKYRPMLAGSLQLQEKINAFLPFGGTISYLHLMDELNPHILLGLSLNKDVMILEFTSESSANVFCIYNDFNKGFLLKKHMTIENLSYLFMGLTNLYLIAKSDNQWLGKIFLPNESACDFIKGIKQQQLFFSSKQAFYVPDDTGTGHCTFLGCLKDEGWAVIHIPVLFIADNEKRDFGKACNTSVVKFLAEQPERSSFENLFPAAGNALYNEAAAYPLWPGDAHYYKEAHPRNRPPKEGPKVTRSMSAGSAGLPAPGMPTIDRSKKPRYPEKSETMDSTLANRRHGALNIPEDDPFLPHQEKTLDITLPFWDLRVEELRQHFKNRPVTYKETLQAAKKINDEYERFMYIDSIYIDNKKFFNEVQKKMNEIESSCPCDNDYPEDVIKCFISTFISLVETRLENMTIDLKNRNYNERQSPELNMPGVFDDFNNEILQLIKGCSEKGRSYLSIFETHLAKDDFFDISDQAATLKSWIHGSYQFEVEKASHLPTAEKKLSLAAIVTNIKKIKTKKRRTDSSSIAENIVEKSKFYKVANRLCRCISEVKSGNLSLAGEVPLCDIEEAFELIINYFDDNTMADIAMQTLHEKESRMLKLFIQAILDFRRPAKLKSPAFNRMLENKYWSDEDVKEFIEDFLSTEEALANFSIHFKNKLRVATGLERDLRPFSQRAKEEPLLTTFKNSLNYFIESYKKDRLNYRKLDYYSESLLLSRQSYHLFEMVEHYLGERVLVGHEYRKTIRMLSQIEHFKRKIFHRFFVNEMDEESDSLSSSKLFCYAMELGANVVSIKMEYHDNCTCWAIFYDTHGKCLGKMQFDCLSPDGVPYMNTFANSMILALGRERTMTIAITPGSHQISDVGTYYRSVKEVMNAYRLKITGTTEEGHTVQAIKPTPNRLDRLFQYINLKKK